MRRYLRMRRLWLVGTAVWLLVAMAFAAAGDWLEAALAVWIAILHAVIYDLRGGG